MAGIGFRLKPLIHSEIPFQRLKGGAAAVLLSSGPWLLAIFSVVTIASFFMNKVPPHDQQLFRALVNSTYAFAFILSSSFELVFSRWISDLIYQRKNGKVGDVHLFHVGLLTGLFAILWGLFCFAVAELPFLLLWSVVALGASSVWMWASAAVIHAVKDYTSVLARSILGAILAIVFSVLLGKILRLGVAGFIYGISLGQLFVAVSLSFKVLSEFGSQTVVQWREFRVIFYRFRYYALIGLLTGLGLWVDKILFWTHPDTSEIIQSFWVKSSIYDVCVFSSYLSVIPAIAVFFVSIETHFFLTLRNWVACIENHAPLSMIRQYRFTMIRVLQRDTVALLLFQGAMTFSVLYFSNPIAIFLKMPTEFSSILRMTAIGSMLYVCMVFVNLLLLYLEKTKEVLSINLFFFVSNGALTWLSLRMGPSYYGMGYALASLFSLAFGSQLLRVRLNDLERRFFQDRSW